MLMQQQKAISKVDLLRSCVTILDDAAAWCRRACIVHAATTGDYISPARHCTGSHVLAPITCTPSQLSGHLRLLLLLVIQFDMAFLPSSSPASQALSEQPGALELQKVLINLLVDFGVMAAAAFCYSFET